MVVTLVTARNALHGAVTILLAAVTPLHTTNVCTPLQQFGATLGGPLSNVSWSQSAIQSMEDDFSDQENCVSDRVAIFIENDAS